MTMEDMTPEMSEEVEAPQGIDLKKRTESWCAGIDGISKRAGTKRLFGALAILAAITFAILSANVLSSVQGLAFGLVLASVVAAVWIFIWASRAQERDIQQLGGEILRRCEAEELSKADVVEAIIGQVGPGPARHRTLMSVDPEATRLFEVRERGMKVFEEQENKKIEPVNVEIQFDQSSGRVSSAKVEGEEFADLLCDLGLDYLDQKAHVEALAALAASSTVYGAIAPDGMGWLLALSRATNELQVKVTKMTYDVFKTFDFTSEFKVLHQALQRQQALPLLELLKQAVGQSGEEDTSKRFAEALSESGQPMVRDDLFVQRCIDYIGTRTGASQTFRAAQAMAQIPHPRAIPHIIDAFQELPFHPQGIEAMARFGDTARPILIETLRSTSSPNCQFNVALALGVMKVESAKPMLLEMLDTCTDSIARIGCAFALAMMDEDKWIDEIVCRMPDADDNVRHAAAIALEHLPQPLDEGVFEKGMKDKSPVVRLRFARKMGSQGTENPSVIESLIQHLDDENDDVRSTVIEAVGKLQGEAVYERLTATASASAGKKRGSALRALGKLGDERAVPMVTKALRTGTEERKAALEALRDLAPPDAASDVAEFLDEEKVSESALWALLSIGLKDREAVEKAIGKRSGKENRLFLRAVLGDDEAKARLKTRMGTGEVPHLVQMAHYAMILRDPMFEAPLQGLRRYRKAANFPGDRYVSHMAAKALVNIRASKPA